MVNRWKLATIGMAVVFTTALLTGLTTAYVLRPAGSTEPDAAARPEPAPARAVAATARPAALAPVRRASARQTAVTTTPAPAATVRTAAAAPAPRAAADCETGGERAWRIAKPGLLGTLIGAGLGAAGGAVADGGDGAGKGALIGGLAGAAVGAGYGAYRTKQQCGTIFGARDLP